MKLNSGIRAHGDNRRYPQDKNQDRQQQHTAAHPGHADQGTLPQADQNLFDEHTNVRLQLLIVTMLRSRRSGWLAIYSDETLRAPGARMISCAASSGLNSAVLITTSASVGSS